MKACKKQFALGMDKPENVLELELTVLQINMGPLCKAREYQSYSSKYSTGKAISVGILRLASSCLSHLQCS